MASLTQQLVSLLRRPITAADRERACLHLLDWLGCSLLGARSETGNKLLRLLQDMAGSGPCATLGYRHSDWQSALWLNAAVGNIEEMDDVHRTSVLHPGPVVIPAAIAAVQQQGGSAQALLDSIIIGYETVIRIGQALGPDHYRFYHNTATCGSFGAAAAVARVLNLSDDETLWAIGNAGSRTGGLWQMRNESVETKQFHNVDAALTGSLAAYMARSQIRGPAAILEGPQGFFAATSPLADGQRVVAEPEAPWLLWQCSFKPWPACRHVHATIDATLQLASSRPASEIRAIEVSSYGDALVFCNRPAPETTLQAKFSLHHAVAVCLLHGAPQLQHFTPDYFNDAEVQALRQKVQAVEDAAIAARYPQHFGARVSVEYTDGQRITAEVQDAWGDPEAPMTQAQIIAKAETLMSAAGIAADQCHQLIEATLALPQSDSLDHWVELLPTNFGVSP